MMFFETSAKTSQNLNLMMYTAIAELPFFSQFDIDKNTLIEELKNLNCKTEEQPKEPIINIKDEKGEVKQTKIIIKRKKKNCAC